jgi:NMD protein affecting ribosome stability and mRNA decay
MNAQTSRTRPGRGDRLIRDHVHDPYKATKKLPEPTVCPGCKAVHVGGHWQWKESWPIDAHQELCHACRRTRDGYPAGIVTLRGAFAIARRQELVQLARQHEACEKAVHPMHRIMKVEESPEAIVISTTDLHLPRRIGDAMHHAYKGDLDTHYDHDGSLLRVNWSRKE